MSYQLEICNLTKIYDKQVKALSSFNLTFNKGITGLLGPNGAGKSTLMKIIATIVNPTEGKVLWNDIDVKKKSNEIRKILGYLPQSFGVYPKLTANEFLEYIAALKGINRKLAKERIHEILQIVNLHHLQNTPLSNYSGGMKQRIGIAQALLNDPKLLIIDEPTAGLDPEERVRFRQLMADLAGERIIILSTHIVSDVEACANTIALINKGELLQNTVPEQLIKSVQDKVWSYNIASSELPEVQNKYRISRTLRVKEGVKVRVINDTKPHAEAENVSPTLEDAYLYYVSNDRNPQSELER